VEQENETKTKECTQKISGMRLFQEKITNIFIRNYFYFVFTVVMKVLVSCMEISIFFNKVLIKVIFSEKQNSLD
jgi:hypothetical protein